MSKKPRIVVFASGTAEGGGSSFQELVENSRTGVLNADIVAVVSNHANGGVCKRAEKLGVPFIHFPGPWEACDYQAAVNLAGAQWCILSGWLKLVKGLDPRRTINIHPGPLPEFGGRRMYGHFVHEKVIAAYRMGQIKKSAVSMHFVTEKYDKGPIFFRYPVLIRPDDTPETLAERVNKIEHGWQSLITNLVVHGQISWDGKNRKSLKVPDGYQFHRP
ncbi:phosphoribosylglycinamide formyltransferase [Candidatus Falkowbacteria bacterium]|nr:phosphoribosylglycinamide formyltransferase [Candidatus Falkowbacteria bacterium]